MIVNMSKSSDELRVERSIQSIISKIEASILRTEPKRYRAWLESERELEEKCIENNMVYSPTKFMNLL